MIRFKRTIGPNQQELTILVHTISHRVARYDVHHPWRTPFGRTMCVQIPSREICLERQGVLERDEDDCRDAGGRATQEAKAENCYLQLDGIDEDPMQQLMGCSVSYRIALGPQQGRKVFTLQTLAAVEEDDRYAQVAKEAGFTTGILPFALWVSLRLFKIAPDDFVVYMPG